MFKEAMAWSILYIGIAVSFGIWVWSYFGSVLGTEYLAAYLVEKSLRSITYLSSLSFLRNLQFLAFIIREFF